MSGHAPEIRNHDRRLREWLLELSDLRLSLYMLLLALALAAGFLLLDRGLLR